MVLNILLAYSFPLNILAYSLPLSILAYSLPLNILAYSFPLNIQCSILQALYYNTCSKLQKLSR